MENVQEPWQVEANGQVFDTSLDEIKAWIEEGSVLRQDKVRKGNLRWIEAGKVPALMPFFNTGERGAASGPVVTTTDVNQGFSQPAAIAANFHEPNPSPCLPAEQTFQSPGTPNYSIGAPAAGCSLHPEDEASYYCGTCANYFCKTCPPRFGTNVRICPFCGAMCQSLEKAAEDQHKKRTYERAMREGFGFSDFFRALAHPFKFKTSLILGAIMFAFFSLGQSSVGFGGIFLLSSALVCFMLANMLSFGVLGNTVENFSQGKLDESFMPSFDDFSVWDDIVHPFFISIGVYISSFGPLALIVVLCILFLLKPSQQPVSGLETDASHMVVPELPYAANAADQSQRVRELLKKTQQDKKERSEFDEETLQPKTAPPDRALQRNEDEEEEFAKVNKSIQDMRRAQLESVVGKSQDTVQKEQAETVRNIIGYGVFFLLLAGIGLLWGLFYFPAACIVAGYTQSFRATCNPLIGLDTIRRLGVDYVKILLMGLVLMIVMGVIALFFNLLLYPFGLPGVGNLPAKVISSFFNFYLWIVFSCVIGYAMYKKSNELELLQG